MLRGADVAGVPGRHLGAPASPDPTVTQVCVADRCVSSLLKESSLKRGLLAPNRPVTMAEPSHAHPKGLFKTLRQDNWWWYPVGTAITLGLFGIYTMYVAIIGAGGPDTFLYHAGGREYLSPFFSPCLTGYCGDANLLWFNIGEFATVSPAWFVMWAPLGLRATCYYYRKAYYRAFFLDPPGCAVGEAKHKYHGERAFPFVLQNLHRYFLYVALLFPIFLYWDAILGFIHFYDDGSHGFHIGLGGIILFVNATLLTGFTFGCHALRHLVGGRLNCFSCSSLSGAQHGVWKGVTWFNKHHGKWAWTSLVFVGFTDIYIRGLLNGWWSDPLWVVF